MNLAALQEGMDSPRIEYFTPRRVAEAPEDVRALGVLWRVFSGFWKVCTQ